LQRDAAIMEMRATANPSPPLLPPPQRISTSPLSRPSMSIATSLAAPRGVFHEDDAGHLYCSMAS